MGSTRLITKQEMLSKIQVFEACRYINCEIMHVRDLYHCIAQYHLCQMTEGRCEMCRELFGGCNECMKMTPTFINDCDDVIQDLYLLEE